MALVNLRKTLTGLVGMVRGWALAKYDAKVRDMGPPPSLGESCLEIVQSGLSRAVVQNSWSRPLKEGDTLLLQGAFPPINLQFTALPGKSPTSAEWNKTIHEALQLAVTVRGEPKPCEGKLPQTPRQLRQTMWHRGRVGWVWDACQKMTMENLPFDDALKFLRLVDAGRRAT